MPPLPAVNGLIRVLLQYTSSTVTPILNRIFFQGTGSTTNSALNTYCTNVASAWNTNMAAQISPDTELVAVTAEDLTSTTSPVGAATVTHPGTNANSGGFPAGAFIVRNHTNLRERGGHSRTYIQGVPSQVLSSPGGNLWGTATAAAIITAWTAFINAIQGANAPTGYSSYAQVMPNYYHGFTSVQNPITKRYRNVPTLLATPNVYVITAYTYNPIVGSQRRRNKQTS